MASRTRRARVALGIIALAVIGLGVWRGEALYWWVMTERVYCDRVLGKKHLRGYRTPSRWEHRFLHGEVVLWDIDTGFLFSKTTHSAGEQPRATYWNPDGTLRWQVEEENAHTNNFAHLGLDGWGYLDDRKIVRTQPPWLWGVTDQTEPTIPAWMKDDTKWQAVLDAQEVAHSD